MIKVTQKEMEVLEEVEATDLNDGTQDCLYAPIFHEYYDMKVLRGVISSLVKKEIIEVEDEENKCFGSEQTEIIIKPKFIKKDENGYLLITNVEVA